MYYTGFKGNLSLKTNTEVFVSSNHKSIISRKLNLLKTYNDFISSVQTIITEYRGSPVNLTGKRKLITNFITRSSRNQKGLCISSRVLGTKRQRPQRNILFKIFQCFSCKFFVHLVLKISNVYFSLTFWAEFWE